MRPIKFRGKRTDNGEWVYGGYIDENSIAVPVYEESTNYYSIDDVSVNPDTIGQLITTLYGREVYEGDIINSWLTDNSKNWKHVAYWDDYGVAFRFRCIYSSDNNRIFSSTMMHTKDYWEVIGNIHDNPELLNATDS